MPFWRKHLLQSALAGMVAGTVVLVLWKQVGLGKTMYEIVPGFIANCIMIYTMNFFAAQKDENVLREFEEVITKIRSTTSIL